MNGIVDPVGARPSSVYWRRRAVLLVVAAVGVLLLARACSSGGPEIGTNVVQSEVPLLSTFTPTPTPTPTLTASAVQVPTSQELQAAKASKSATPKPTATVTATATAKPKPKPITDAEAAGPLNCAKKALSVKLRADQGSYGGNEKARLYLAVKNTGKVACLVDLGSKALSFTVMSGDDRIWSSDDCQGKGRSDIRLLKPGQALEARSVWSKVRSVPGCPKGQPEARPGTYLLEGAAGGVEAKKRAVFRLT